ncbi:hypothetical protein B6D16_00860 [Gilliamella apicola]|uniref:hypothetical protein n=1 Tax=Gilliamella apicola TaxID=1196095 RepID=UPI000A3446D5|nr:hypothetical protein [Gilliamella apicola]OTP97259.1 hypothetical protein B6D05_01825 [Gilliamella apicola]OTQ19254.1 hypothetical protein B6D15_02320 [Gilliamella apicola]OTQ21665.1 hypothetical protein B6D16_00860 [Gilliamella apicola]OTQ22972.1 hypothetical protein B6D04_10700 [Gilliamella apicola]
MTNEQFIERLKLKNWYVTCQNKQESNLVLQACDDAGITWAGGEKATEWCPFETYPLDIGFYKDGKGITQDYYNLYEKEEVENLTDWFFKAIKNNDSKLTPQNAEQGHLVQMLLAIMQKIPVEVNFGGEWTTSTILFPSMGYEYRIKPTPTPIPVSRKTWKKINKEFRFIVMDKNKHFYHCKNAPKSSDKTWLLSEVDHVKSPLIFDSNGINWETSLTERPEGV